MATCKSIRIDIIAIFAVIVQLCGHFAHGQDVVKKALAATQNYYTNHPFARISQGNTAYRPLPMLLPKQFYSPRYPVKDAITAPDNRTTIYWEPNVVTDENGKATLSFYTADKLSTYSVRVEGTDMTGNIGWQTGKISVTSKATASK